MVRKKLSFKLEDYVVYPSHGLGRIQAIETEEIAGIPLEMYVISFDRDKMVLRVPTDKTESVGLRGLANRGVVDKAITTLQGRAKTKRVMWSRRAQEYEQKINSGDLVSIAEVVRDLHKRDTEKEQSYSERQLYEAALERFTRELAVVRGHEAGRVLSDVDDILSKRAVVAA